MRYVTKDNETATITLEQTDRGVYFWASKGETRVPFAQLLNDGTLLLANLTDRQAEARRVGLVLTVDRGCMRVALS